MYTYIFWFFLKDGLLVDFNSSEILLMSRSCEENLLYRIDRQLMKKTSLRNRWYVLQLLQIVHCISSLWSPDVLSIMAAAKLLLQGPHGAQGAPVFCFECPVAAIKDVTLGPVRGKLCSQQNSYLKLMSFISDHNVIKLEIINKRNSWNYINRDYIMFLDEMRENRGTADSSHGS